MIPLALAHRLLQPGSKQGTNGGAFLGSENTSFPQKFRFDFQCNIGLHICTYSRAALLYVLSSRRSTASTARRELRTLELGAAAQVQILFAHWGIVPYEEPRFYSFGGAEVFPVAWAHGSRHEPTSTYMRSFAAWEPGLYDVTQGDMDVICLPLTDTTGATIGTFNCYIPSGTNGVLSMSNSSYEPAYAATTGWIGRRNPRLNIP
jgi:hypothetical protein